MSAVDRRGNASTRDPDRIEEGPGRLNTIVDQEYKHEYNPKFRLFNQEEVSVAIGCKGCRVWRDPLGISIQLKTGIAGNDS